MLMKQFKSLNLNKLTMTKEELRNECSRLFECKTIADSNDLLDIYAEFLFNAMTRNYDYSINDSYKACE